MNLLIVFLGLLFGSVFAYCLLTFLPNTKPTPSSTPVANYLKQSQKEVLGFLPYWFLDSANVDYSGKITTLDYFSLTIDKDGTIQKSTSTIELEPGYYALTSGKADPFLTKAKENNIKLALTIFSGDEETISALINDPIQNADNLVVDITPIITKYNFTEINLDIESSRYATLQAQANYVSFVSEVRKKLNSQNPDIILSSDMIPIDFIRTDHLALPSKLANYLDKIIIMAYDFHSPSSFVTGAVAPLYGAGTVAEFDTEVAIKAALKNYDSDKILLGVPFYGYSWETISNVPRSAIIPSSALIKSSKDMEKFLATCTNCTASFDQTAQESYVIYKNEDSQTFQQTFYPDERSISSKVNFVKGNNLGGLAIWALGYESENSTIFTPLEDFLLDR